MPFLVIATRLLDEVANFGNPEWPSAVFWAIRQGLSRRQFPGVPTARGPSPADDGHRRAGHRKRIPTPRSPTSFSTSSRRWRAPCPASRRTTSGRSPAWRPVPSLLTS
jgi:hypothetical protein